MSDCCTFASAQHRQPMTLLSMIGRWLLRIEMRRELKRRSVARSAPRDDIGDAGPKAELSGSFWQV